jgi:hypothetical protein
MSNVSASWLSPCKEFLLKSVVVILCSIAYQYAGSFASLNNGLSVVYLKEYAKSGRS